MLANHENILTVHPVTDGRTRTEARTDGQFERPKLEHVERLPSLPTYVLRARAREGSLVRPFVCRRRRSQAALPSASREQKERAAAISASEISTDSAAPPVIARPRLASPALTTVEIKSPSCGAMSMLAVSTVTERRDEPCPSPGRINSFDGGLLPLQTVDTAHAAE